jgi:hypothetical protein
MTNPKEKPPQPQQHGTHIDSLPVESNSPAPERSEIITSTLPSPRVAALLKKMRDEAAE